MRALVGAIVILVACAPSAKPEQLVPAAPPAPAPVPRAPADVANDLSLLATGMPATPDEQAKLAAASYSREAFAGYIDELVKRPSLAMIAGGVLRITGGAERNVIAMPVLKEQGGVLYLHEPCDASQAVPVKPWWDLSTTVRVCPAAYRPEIFATPDGNACSGVYASPREATSPCGCGPNLMRCARTESDKNAIKQAIFREARATLAYVIDKDLPLQTLFASPESFRTGHAELLYQRWRVENRDAASLEAMPDWRQWPKDGAWAPRPASKAGQHAGIFTNHFTPQMADSQRMKLANFFEILWCQPGDSLRVKTETVLDIAEHSGANLRGTVKVGPNELAARPLCTDCHARLDYGVQFFAGIQWHYRALHYVSSAQSDAMGELYHQNIDDLRGRAKRNPQGFVELALAQPEFPACMAKNFLMHAFSTATDPSLAPLADELRGIVERKGSYRELMQRTLAAYAERALARGDSYVPPAQETISQRAKQIAEVVVDRCADCHTADDGYVTAAILEHGAAWCQKSGPECARIGAEIMNVVAFDRMPKDAPLTPTDKRKLFELFAPVVWPDARSRESARRYYVDTTLAPPTHRLDAMTTWIRTAAGGKPPVELPGVSPERSFSVSTAVELAITAARVCAGDTDQTACFERAMKAEAFEK